MTWFSLELNMVFSYVGCGNSMDKKIGYGKIMSWILPRTHIKIYKRTKSGLQM